MTMADQRAEQIARIKRLEQIERIKQLEAAPRNIPEPKPLGERIASGLQDVADFTTALAPKSPLRDAGEYLGDAFRAGINKDLSFEDARMETLAKNERIERDYPIPSLVGHITGIAATPGAPTLKTTARMMYGSAPKAANALFHAPKVISGPANAVSRIGYGAGMAKLSSSLQHQGEEASDEAASKAATIGTGVEALTGLAKGARKIAGPVIFGVKKATEKAYKARAPIINRLDPAAEEQKLVQAVDTMRDSVRGAEDNLSKVSESVRGKVKDVKRGLSERFRRVDADAKDAIAKFKESSSPTTDDADALVAAAKNYRREISKKSGEAFDVLNNTPTTFDLAKVKGYVTQKTNDLKIAGKDLKITADDYGALQLIRDDLDALPRHLRPEDMKRYIQALDSKVENIYDTVRAGGRITRGDKSVLDVRRFMDDYLKDIEPYKKVMGDISERTGTLKKLEDFVTSPQTAQRTLKAAQKDGYQQKAIAQFDKSAGTTFAKDAQGKMAQAELGIQGQKDRLLGTKESNFRRGQMAERGAKGRVKQAEDQIESAKVWLDPVQGIRDSTAQNYMRVAGNVDRLNARDKLDRLKYLDEIKGTNFAQTAEDIATKQALEQGFTRGSRNVNLGSASLGGLAGGISKVVGRHLDSAGDLGRMVGAFGGAIADTMGPQVYKKLLDLEMRPGFQNAAHLLKQAAQRSPASVITTHYLMMDSDPAYRAYMNGGRTVGGSARPAAMGAEDYRPQVRP